MTSPRGSQCVFSTDHGAYTSWWNKTRRRTKIECFNTISWAWNGWYRGYVHVSTRLFVGIKALAPGDTNRQLPLSGRWCCVLHHRRCLTGSMLMSAAGPSRYHARVLTGLENRSCGHQWNSSGGITHSIGARNAEGTGWSPAWCKSLVA